MRRIPTFLFITFFSFTAWAFAQGQMLDRVVAVVNEDAITQSELDLYLRPFYEALKKEYSGDQLLRQLNEVRGKLLNQLIEDKLVYQKAKDVGVETSEDEINNELAAFRKKFKTDTQFDDALRTEGLTQTELKERLKKQLMIRRLHDMEIRSKIIVSPLEAQNYFKEHPEEFDQTDLVKVRSITIKKSDDAREKGLTDESALKRITDLRKKILSGEDFAQLAMQNSEDYQAAGGGLSEWISPGSMIPEIDGVIFKLPKGEVSQILETPMGYHLFRVEEKKQAEKKNFEQVREQIYDKLYHQKAKVRFQEWMESLKRKAYISVR